VDLRLKHRSQLYLKVFLRGILIEKLRKGEEYLAATLNSFKDEDVTVCGVQYAMCGVRLSGIRIHAVCCSVRQSARLCPAVQQ
jgi:hypothetical protein